MPKIIIADTSCLIVLEQIGELSLLEKIYSEILITPEIQQEFLGVLPDWIKIIEVSDKKRQDILEVDLDKGEASAIALSLEQEDCLLIIDERKGRAIAKKLGLRITGTLGVIVKAKRNGIIVSVKDVLEKLEKYDFWISDSLKEKIIKESGEL